MNTKNDFNLQSYRISVPNTMIISKYKYDQSGQIYKGVFWWIWPLTGVTKITVIGIPRTDGGNLGLTIV